MARVHCHTTSETLERSVLSQLHNSSMAPTQLQSVSSATSDSHSTHTDGNQHSSSNAQSIRQELAYREVVCDSSSRSDTAVLQTVFTA
jgi:hypothetical protein